MQHKSRSTTRRDGWTPERQLRFLDTLARTHCVTRAAAVAGMSRKSAYRLRGRVDGALFAAMWDRAMRAPLATVKVTAQGDTAADAVRETSEIRRRTRSGGSGKTPGSTRSPRCSVTFVTTARGRFHP